MHQGTVHINLKSPKIASITSCILNNVDFDVLQSLAVDLDLASEPIAIDMATKWSRLLDLLEQIPKLRHLTLCPGPQWVHDRIQEVVSRLSCRSVMFVVRYTSSIQVAGYWTSRNRLEFPLHHSSVTLPALKSVGFFREQVGPDQWSQKSISSHEDDPQQEHWLRQFYSF